MAPKMSYPINLFLIVTISSFFLSSQAAKYFLPILKDECVGQYYTSFTIGNPPLKVQTVIDTSNLYNWIACDNAGYTKSTTFRPIDCDEAKCGEYMHGFYACVDCSSFYRPGCTNHTCGAYAYTPWDYGSYALGIIEDNITLSTGWSPSHSSKTSLPNFPLTCGLDERLKGLSPQTKGILTLANANMAIQYQVSSTLKVPNKFALCLPSRSNHGAIYFGGAPYYLPPRGIDLSRYIVKIPLVNNYHNTAPSSFEFEPSSEYFIKVRTIKVMGEPVRFNDDESLLEFSEWGAGGTKIHTLTSYTRLNTIIYDALIDVFVSKANSMNITRVNSMAGFGACFNSTTIGDSKAGPNVPYIDLIMENHSPVLNGKNARWRFYGAQSMVSVTKDVSCLAFVDGGPLINDGNLPRASIQIGGKQMEDALVEVDLESSTLGVISSLQRLGTSCSQFREL